jgi:hypothetical protein
VHALLPFTGAKCRHLPKSGRFMGDFFVDMPVVSRYIYKASVFLGKFGVVADAPLFWQGREKQLPITHPGQRKHLSSFHHPKKSAWTAGGSRPRWKRTMSSTIPRTPGCCLSRSMSAPASSDPLWKRFSARPLCRMTCRCTLKSSFSRTRP